MDYFSQHIFSDIFRTPEKYPWTLASFDETMTAGYFLGGGGIFPPLTAVFPPFLRLPVITVYYFFQKIIHPQDPPTTGSHANIPPLQNIPRKYPDDDDVVYLNSYEVLRESESIRGRCFTQSTRRVRTELC